MRFRLHALSDSAPRASLEDAAAAQEGLLLGRAPTEEERLLATLVAEPDDADVRGLPTAVLDPDCLARLRQLKLLVIDEISMVRSRRVRDASQAPTWVRLPNPNPGESHRTGDDRRCAPARPKLHRQIRRWGGD